MSSIVTLSILSTIFFLLIGNTYFLFAEAFFELNQFMFNVMLVNGFSMFIISLMQQYFTINVSKYKYLILSFIAMSLNIGFSILFMITIFSDNRYYGRTIGSTFGLAMLAIVIIFTLLFRGKIYIKWNYWRYALYLSLPIIPHSLSNVVLAQMDKVMLTSMRSLDESGVYAFYTNAALILNVIWQSLNLAWVPWFFERMSKKSYGEIKKVSNLYMNVFLVLSLGFMAISFDLVRFIGRTEYLAYNLLIVPLIIATYFQFLYSLPVNTEFYLKRNRIIAFGTILSALVNVVLNYFLIPIYGFYAAAYTTALTYLLLFIAHYLIYRHVFHIKIFSLKRMIIGIVFVLAYAALLHFIDGLVVFRYLLLVLMLAPIILASWVEMKK